METNTLTFENLINVLNEYGQELVNLYKQKLTENNVNASYALYNSVKYQVSDLNKNKFEITLSLADYWKYVENGRKAGKFPPISKIENWIKIKPVIPYSNNDKKIPTQKKIPKQGGGLAYWISRKIAIQGIQPRPFLKNSVEEINRIYFDKIEEALTKDTERIFDDAFATLHLKSEL